MIRRIVAWRRRRANAIVEFALVLPIVAGAAVFVADMGAVANRNMTLKGAVRAGAEFAMRTQDIESVPAVVAAAANRDLRNLTVTARQYCVCGTTEITCGAFCESPERIYMSVMASETYPPLISPAGFGRHRGGVEARISAEATLRTK